MDVSGHKIGVSFNVGATLGLGDLGGCVSVGPAKSISDIDRVAPWHWHVHL